MCCIWNCKVEDRRCEFCSYPGCAERRVKLGGDVPTIARNYINIASSIVGGDVLDKSRVRSLVWGRYIVIAQLYNDGYSLNQVGEIMDMDHASIFHAKQQVSQMLQNPRMYPVETGMWEKFQEALSLQKL